MTTTTAIDPLAVAAKLRGILDELDTRLVGRRTHCHLTMVALASRTHLLMHGEPGTGKTMSVEALLDFLPDVSIFKTQAYKASTPEQFLGPISYKAMEQDRYERITAGRFADCHIAAIDELPRAPRAMLPAFQGGMVERTFDNGSGPMPIPLMTFLGTSNHIPDDSELEAFFDRLTWKIVVERSQSQEDFKAILRGAIERRANPARFIPNPDLFVTLDELAALQAFVDLVTVPDEILDAIGELWMNLLAAGVRPSDRRYTSMIAGLQATAALRGDDTVVIDDLLLLQHALWSSEAEIPVVYGEILKFASEWEREKATLLDAHADLRAKFSEMQNGYAQTHDANVARNAAIQIASDARDLGGLLDKHVAAAGTGADVSALQRGRADVDVFRAWISNRLMGGLNL